MLTSMPKIQTIASRYSRKNKPRGHFFFNSDWKLIFKGSFSLCEFFSLWRLPGPKIPSECYKSYDSCLSVIRINFSIVHYRKNEKWVHDHNLKMNIPPKTDQWPGKCSKKHANSCWTLFVPLYNLIKPSAKPAWLRVEHDIQTSKKAGTAHVHTWLPILLNVSCCTPKILSTFRRLNFSCHWWANKTSSTCKYFEGIFDVCDERLTDDRMLIGYSRNNKEKD